MGYLIVHSDELPSYLDFDEKESFTDQEIQRMHCFSIPESQDKKNPKHIRDLNRKLYHATKRHVDEMMHEEQRD